MRTPDDLTADELATLNVLWAIYPDEIVSRPDRDHSKLDGLIADGFVERVDHGKDGTGYRLAAPHAAGLAKVAATIAGEAGLN